MAAKTPKPLKDSGGHVKVKPAAKSVGNPPNPAKTLNSIANSHYRTWNPETGMEDGVRSAGKSKDARVANSKNPTASSRTTAGIAGKSGAKVIKIYKPMGGSGIGLLSIKNR